jgi:hypothetical protein
MLTNLEILLLALAAIFGALGSGAIGWLDSGEVFDWRKYTSTMLRAIFAGLLFAFTNFALRETIIPWDYLAAILGGAGIDVFGNRLAGAVAARIKTTPS